MAPSGLQNAPGCTPNCPEGGSLVGLGLGFLVGGFVVGLGLGLLVVAFGRGLTVVTAGAGVVVVVSAAGAASAVGSSVAGVSVTTLAAGRLGWSVGVQPARTTPRTARLIRAGFGRGMFIRTPSAVSNPDAIDRSCTGAARTGRLPVISAWAWQPLVSSA
jgi:hypothetical protein